MKTLNSLATHLTDKHTSHSYLDVYQPLFNDIQLTTKNILEIGIQYGGGHLLWHDFFPTATIYGCDINDAPNVLKNLDRMVLYKANAYDINFINNNFQNVNFDIIIDDGPHTIESMLFFAKYYSLLLSSNGVLIIEDVQSIDWVQHIIDAFPLELKPFVYVEDRRHIKNRYDDILIILDKRKIKN